MTFDDEAVMAYVDGELDASARAAFEQALAARGALAQALNERLSGEPAADGVRIGLSFVAQQGHYCRSFVLQSPSTAGLACHADGGWRLELVTAPVGGGPAPAYRQAGSEM